MLSQDNRADAKPGVDLNGCCDAVHVTPEINIHQQQVGLMLACCEDRLLPRSHRPNEHISKLVEKVCEAESLNRVSLRDQDAKRRWGRGRPHGQGCSTLCLRGTARVAP